METVLPLVQIDQVLLVSQVMVPSAQPPGMMDATERRRRVVRLMKEVLLVGTGGVEEGGGGGGGFDPSPLPGVVLSHEIVVTPVPTTCGPGFLNLID